MRTVSFPKGSQLTTDLCVSRFITEPLVKAGETRCYIRDPDVYIIEVGRVEEAVGLIV
jgi:hypothetical protein